MIFFEEDRVIVGNQAKEEALINPEDTVSYIKKHMGDKDFKYARKDGQFFSPEDLSAIILKKLKKTRNFSPMVGQLEILSKLPSGKRP